MPTALQQRSDDRVATPVVVLGAPTRRGGRRRYLLLLLVVLAVALAAVPYRATSQVGASNIDIDAVADHPDPAVRLLRLINAERAAVGLSPLRTNETLELIATDWATTMADESRLYHRPDLAEVVTSRWIRMGENVGVGPEIDRLHQAFMDSDGHRRQVQGDYDQVGVAVVTGRSRIWVAVNFGIGTITSTTVTPPAVSTTSATVAGFRDVPVPAVHGSGIEALVDAGVTTGCDEDNFCPSTKVTRGQMAAFVARAMGLRTSGSAGLSDVAAGSPFDGAIAAVTGAGVMEPCAAGRFCPTAPVDRASMAGILTRALDLPTGDTSSRFSDVRGELVAEVEAIASAGVTSGCGDGRYCPTALVSRAEMATFLTNAFDL